MTTSRPTDGARAAGAPDRRQFLRIAGLGGLGVAALGTLTGLPSVALAADIDAITLGNRINSLNRASNSYHSNWAEWCQAAQYWAERAGGNGGARSYGTARDAYHASTIVSHSMSAAPAGSFSYYDKSADGHVVTNIGNGWCINTSPLTRGASVHDFGRGLYICRLSDYYPSTYLGWSHGNGSNPQIPVSPWSHGDSGDSWAFNTPSSSMQERIQKALTARGRYSGPVDGKWGPATKKGIQTTCANVGYDGPVDGVPGERTCHYVQVYAKKFGDYSGPVDSRLGPNSWAGFALGLERP